MIKGIWGIILAASFVFGTTGTIAFAAPPDHAGPPTGEPGNPFDQIIETLNGVIGALNELEAKAKQNMMEIMGLDERVAALESASETDNDSDPTNELQDLSFNPETRTLSISERNSVFIPEVDDEVLVGFAKLDENNVFTGANSFEGPLRFSPGPVTFQGAPVDFSAIHANEICIRGDCRSAWPSGDDLLMGVAYDEFQTTILFGTPAREIMSMDLNFPTRGFALVSIDIPYHELAGESDVLGTSIFVNDELQRTTLLEIPPLGFEHHHAQAFVEVPEGPVHLEVIAGTLDGRAVYEACRDSFCTMSVTAFTTNALTLQALP